jgi:hypothetical protein
MTKFESLLEDFEKILTKLDEVLKLEKKQKSIETPPYKDLRLT